jgi:catechol 2,3-dioxygenase-like lactoylglutathione lyase family enzyme
VSKETGDVRRLVDFYTRFLGFVPLQRPAFPFGGAWLFLPPCTAMHIILKDPDPAHHLPEAPTAAVAGDDPQRESFHPQKNPHARYHPIGISRGHHYAFRVTDIVAAEQRLIEAGIVYRKNTSPPNFLLTAEGEQVNAPEHAEPVSQIFFFDPDGNGVEIGNFAPVQPGFAPPLKGVLPPVLVTAGPERPPRPLSAAPPLIDVHSLNHCARETPNVERVTKWYCEMLGFRRLDRPAIPFDGSWLYMPPSTALHIIHTRDDWPRLPEGAGSDARIEELKDGRFGTFHAPAPPIGVRRSHHLAFRVLDIAEAQATLTAHGVEFGSATVPNTEPPVVQLFLFDCDGNGVEIGNFHDAMPAFDPELKTLV